ncbi:unnamed protein product [Dovyalis caffra]|uniref:Resolvase/invertase-type recombinase catalytic domain-containing protein n=1 Tax=Dovyalis caffra TaxID=77055 RepID=A0AAV1SV02_9ROSI|nr:unnamed protein product [Dovyalis caffra]
MAYVRFSQRDTSDSGEESVSMSIARLWTWMERLVGEAIVTINNFQIIKGFHTGIHDVLNNWWIKDT